MSTELDYSFAAMGSEIRLLIGERLVAGAPPPLAAADREREFVLEFGRRLSRFEPASDLSALNHDPRPVVAAPPLLRTAVRAGLWAAERSGGLVDPTLVRALEVNGYAHSLRDARPASLREALAAAPVRRAAAPNPRSRWEDVTVDDARGTVARPPGVMFDTGGTGKGLCADAVAVRLAAYSRFVVDCGGDIVVGGVGAQLRPYAVAIEHPLTGRSIGSIPVAGGGIATSGLNVRIWRRPDGGFAHHLLDPSTGRPAWTGLVGATALAGSALEAETLSKMALLLGADDARRILAPQGGLIVHDDGEVEPIGRVAAELSTNRPTAAPPLVLG
ncbi:MAG TPA: FAD:protein FMN transferase [Solirubrobacteraceae bacterium]|nr:FAD:protein FMN transferase [Solirubrobacteraceae bacterium]